MIEQKTNPRLNVLLLVFNNGDTSFEIKYLLAHAINYDLKIRNVASNRCLYEKKQILIEKERLGEINVEFNIPEYNFDVEQKEIEDTLKSMT